MTAVNARTPAIELGPQPDLHMRDAQVGHMGDDETVEVEMVWLAVRP